MRHPAKGVCLRRRRQRWQDSQQPTAVRSARCTGSARQPLLRTSILLQRQLLGQRDWCRRAVAVAVAVETMAAASGTER